MRSALAAAAALAVLLPGLPACDSGTSGGPAAVAPTREACGFPIPASATIDISQRHDVFHSDVYARIEARLEASPRPNFHAVVATEGACRYLSRAPGFCDPPCSGGALCTAESVCAPFPEALSGGTITIGGLDAPVEMPAQAWSPGSYQGPTNLSPDSLSTATELSARIAGDAFPKASLATFAVARMDPDLTASGLTLTDGEDGQVTWTAGPDPAACVRVVINGFNNAHGAPLADIIECEGPDTGTLTIPQALVERFPLGETPTVTDNFDWPHSQLTRYSRTATTTSMGRVELIVRSTTWFPLSHVAP